MEQQVFISYNYYTSFSYVILIAHMHAVQGANRDYSVNTGSVSFSRSTAGTAAVIFRVDSLGLEVPESFTLRLGDANPSPTSDGVFFVNTLDLVIEDGDGKTSCVICVVTSKDNR